MSNGGYKGASPARETSPEQYPGVWELTEQFQAQADGNWPFQAADCAPKSLRFNGTNGYLTKTPLVEGSKTCWTWAAWVKRGKLGSFQYLFDCGSGSSPEEAPIRFWSDDRLNISAHTTSNVYNLTTSAKYRDTSAWMAICVSFNSNNPVANDRIKLYVNGERITEFDAQTPPTLGASYYVNQTIRHDIGRAVTGNYRYFGGLMSEVHFIDGQELSCEEFGFFDGQGIWQPKRFTGDYAAGEFYAGTLTGVDGSTVSNPQRAFDGDLTTSSNTTGGTKFTPKGGSQSNVTSLRFYSKSFGQGGTIKLNGTTIESSYDFGQGGWYAFSSTALSNISNTLTSFEWDRQPGSGSNNYDYIYAIEINGEVLREGTVGRNSFHLDFFDGVKDQSGVGNDWTSVNTVPYNPSTTTYSSALTTTLGISSAVTNAFDGSDSTSANVNNTTTNGDVLRWTFSPSSPITVNSSIAFKIGPYAPGGGQTAYGQIGTDTFTYNVTSSPTVQTFPFTGTISSTTPLKIYSNRQGYSGGYSTAFYSLYVDGIPLIDAGVDTDLFVDSPVNGNEASTGAGGQRRGCYCTWNPLTKGTYSNGNLDSSNNIAQIGTGTIGVSSGKHYWEVTCTSSSSHLCVGITPSAYLTNNYPGESSTTGHSIYFSSGAILPSGSSYGGFSNGDVLNVKLDLDNGDLYFGKNGTYFNSGNAIVTGLTGTWFPAIGSASGVHTARTNFGQRAFKYPVSGFSPLATSFLPEPTIKRGDEAMDVALWTGNNGIQQLSDFRISPDLVWIKNRDSGSYGHRIVDSVRGATYRLQPHTNSAQGQETTGLTAFTDDGFTLGAAQDYNLSANNHVGWMWDAGDTTTTIAAGGSNSSAYDQSATWSTSGTMSGFSTSGTYDFAHLFNGVLGADTPGTANQMTSPSGGSGTWTYTINNVTEFKIRLYVPGGTHATANSIKINGTDIVQAQILDKGLSNDAWHTVTVPGITTFTSLFVEDNYWYVSNIYINGKELVDAINDSQTWSNGLNGLSGSTITNPTRAFNGNPDNYADSTAGFTVDLSGHTFGTGAHTIEVLSGGATSFSVNGSTNLTDPGGGGAKVWSGTHTGELTSLTSSATGASIYYLKIDGKFLVDPGENTVTNVPEVECKVRANQDAGFSIVKVDSPTNTQTRVHGLSKAPEFFICKSTASADSWHTYWAELGKDYYINIYPIGSKNSSDQFGSQEPNSVSFYVKPNTGSGANKSGGMIYYLWHSVEGFSKFSSYTGTGGDVFVYCGFRPRVITIKNADQSNNWLTYDTARNPSNVANRSIQWDFSYNDNGITNDDIDILSNGFMIKATRNDLTGSGHKILFGAWAEHPFASNCRAR